MAVTTTFEPESPPDNRGRDMAGEPLSQAVVERIRDGLATVLVGSEAEEWAFPAHLLPPEAIEGGLLILEGNGRNFQIIGIAAHQTDGVHERLARSLTRRRRIVFPLPHREIPVPVPDTNLPDRPSRMARDLGHTSRTR
jgi:hypothetical protein